MLKYLFKIVIHFYFLEINTRKRFWKLWRLEKSTVWAKFWCILFQLDESNEFYNSWIWKTNFRRNWTVSISRKNRKNSNPLELFEFNGELSQTQYILFCSGRKSRSLGWCHCHYQYGCNCKYRNTSNKKT